MSSSDGAVQNGIHRARSWPSPQETATDAGADGIGGTGIAILTSGTALGLVQLNLPAHLQPARGRWDSTDLVSSYHLPSHENAAPLAMGSLAPIVPELERGRGPALLRQALWLDEASRPRYVPPRLGENGGDGVPNQVAVAALLRQAELRAEVDRVLARAGRAPSSGERVTPPRLTILATTLARTTGRGSVLKLAELIGQSRAAPEGPFLLHLALAGLPEQDAGVMARALAGTASCLLELTAIEAQLRRMHHIYRTEAGPDGQPLYTFEDRIADYITLMEPGIKGLDTEQAVRDWHAGLLALLSVLAPGTAALSLRQSMQRWGTATSRLSDRCCPAMFSSIGYAVVGFDAAHEARWLALRDAEVLVRAALEQTATTESALEQLARAAPDRRGIVEALVDVVDPLGRAEELESVRLDRSRPTPDLLRQQIVNLLLADEQGEGEIARLRTRRSAVNVAALNWLREALKSVARHQQFALATLTRDLPDELEEQARRLRAEAEGASDAIRATVVAQRTKLGAPGLAPDAFREALNGLDRVTAAYIRQERLAARTGMVADALRFAAAKIREAERTSGVGPVVDAIRDELRPGGILGRTLQRMRESSDSGDSPAERTLLNGDLRFLLYERFQLGLEADGQPNLNLLDEIFETRQLDTLLLRSLAPELSTRLRAGLAGGAKAAARELIEALVGELTRRHRRQLEELGTIASLMEHLDARDGVRRLRQLYAWAFDYAAPPIQLRDPNIAGAPTPETYAFLEVDDDRTAEVIADVVAPGVQITRARAAGIPVRLVVIRAATGIALDVLENFGPDSVGMAAYEEQQQRWHARDRRATPVHTVPPLEALVEQFLADPCGMVRGAAPG
ncbi:MAG: hypothetical protein M3O34_15455 [Chloroflexota bacterium]|nr:hypothetical protein [Chloroflexota bacterium]